MRLTKVSGEAGRDGVGRPLAVPDVAVGLGVQPERLVAPRELFAAAFGLVDDVEPFLVLVVAVRREEETSARCEGRGGWS